MPAGRARGLIVVVLVAAAIAAACTDARPGSESDAVDESSAPAVEPGTGQSEPLEFEAGSGRASLILDLNRLLFSADELAVGWQAFDAPAPRPRACRFREPLAAAQSSYRPVDGIGDGLRVTIEAHPSPADAEAKLAEMRGPMHEACLEAEYAAAKGLLADGPFDLSTDDPVGRLDQAILDEPGSFTRRTEAVISGPGVERRLLGAESIYVDGRLLIRIDGLRAVEDDRFGNTIEVLTERASLLLGRNEVELTPDPAIDAGIDRLRRGLSGPEPPTPLFAADEAAFVTGPANPTCGRSEASTARLYGPWWAPPDRIGVLYQQGWVFAEPAAANHHVAGLDEVDGACALTEASAFGGVELVFEDSVRRTEDIGGRRIEVLEISAVEVLGSGATIDWVYVEAMTAIEGEVLGWMFIGPAGNEPDLAALTAETAVDVEGGS